LGLSLRLHIEVNFTGFPLGTYFDEERGEEAEHGGFIGEETGDARAAFEFKIDAFQGVGSSEFELMARREVNGVEALEDILLHPGGEFWRGGGIGCHNGFESQAGGGTIRGVEDAPNVGRDLSAQIQAWNIGLGVLLEVELAALPGDSGKDRGARGAQTGMIVANDVGDALEVALLQIEEESPPVGFGLAEGHTEAENRALALGIDAQGDEDGAIDQTAAVADFFVTCVEDEIGINAQLAMAPGVEFDVEFGGAIAEVGGTNRGATELLNNGRDLARRNALDIHY